MCLYSPHKVMDKYINRFIADTGCQLDLDRGPTGICFMAMSDEGQCIGRRYLSTAQLANNSLVQAVMLDFIAQTKRLLESGGANISSNLHPCENHVDGVAVPAAHRDGISDQI